MKTRLNLSSQSSGKNSKMITKIIEKLSKALSEGNLDEYKVVYILSRIRKLIELNQLKNTFKDLNFYCDWALHSEIDRYVPDSFKNKLTNQLKHSENLYPDELFAIFFIQLEQFLQELSLPNTILFDPLKIIFADLMIDVFSDTPLVIKLENIKITVKSPDDKHMYKIIKPVFSINFELLSKPNQEK